MEEDGLNPEQQAIQSIETAIDDSAAIWRYLSASANVRPSLVPLLLPSNPSLPPNHLKYSFYSKIYY
jgi:hypothetical protein